MLSEFANNELFEIHQLAEAQKTQKQANRPLESSLYLSELFTRESLSSNLYVLLDSHLSRKHTLFSAGRLGHTWGGDNKNQKHKAQKVITCSGIVGNLSVLWLLGTVTIE